MPIFLAGTHWDFPLAATTESLCCSPSSGVRRPAPHSMDWVGMISSIGWDCWLKHGVQSGDKSCGAGRSRREHTLGRVGGQLCSSWVVCWRRNFYASKTHLLGGYEGEWHWVKLPKAELERRYVVGGRQWSGEYVLRIHKPNASQLLGWPPSKGEKRSEIGNHVVVVVGVCSERSVALESRRSPDPSPTSCHGRAHLQTLCVSCRALWGRLETVLSSTAAHSDCHLLSQMFNALFWPLQTLHTWYVYIYVHKTLTHLILRRQIIFVRFSWA